MSFSELFAELFGEPTQHPMPARKPVLRCDSCGRFTRSLNPVWDQYRHQIEEEICDRCWGKQSPRGGPVL